MEFFWCNLTSVPKTFTFLYKDWNIADKYTSFVPSIVKTDIQLSDKHNAKKICKGNL